MNIHNNIARFAIGFVALLSLAGCREDFEDEVNPNYSVYTTYTGQFEAIWQAVSDRYSMWDVEPTNWDSIYEVYHPRFEDLDESSRVDTQTLTAYYEDMFSRFRDQHMRIYICNFLSSSGSVITINPSSDQKVAHLNSKSAESWELTEYMMGSYAMLIDTVLNAMYADSTISKKPTIVSDSSYGIDYAIYADIDGVAYLYTSDAYLGYSILTGNTSMARLYYKFLNQAKSDDCKGVILDLRNNQGGVSTEFTYLIAPFIESDLTYGQTRQKAGLGRYDFAPETPAVISTNSSETVQSQLSELTTKADAESDTQMQIWPGQQQQQQQQNYLEEMAELMLSEEYTKPIVALTNSMSASMGEIIAYAVAQLPTGCTIGTRSYGATAGTYASTTTSDLYSTGSFGDSSLSTAYHYGYLTNAFTTFSDGNVYEAVGIPPTYEVTPDYNQMVRGTDLQLNAAIDYIRNGTIPE